MEDGVSCWVILDLADGAQRLKKTDFSGPTAPQDYTTGLAESQITFFILAGCLYTWPKPLNPIEWFSSTWVSHGVSNMILSSSLNSSKFFNHHFSLLFFQGTFLFSSPKTPLGCISLVGHIIGRDEGRGNRLLRHPWGHLYDIETKPGSSKWPLKKVVNVTCLGVKWNWNGAWKVDRVTLKNWD